MQAYIPSGPSASPGGGLDGPEGVIRLCKPKGHERIYSPHTAQF